MAPGTNTGAAHPVFYSPWGSKIDVDDVMKTKVENDAAALLRSYTASADATSIWRRRRCGNPRRSPTRRLSTRS
jgi:membrane-bound ClpP family serine protease